MGLFIIIIKKWFRGYMVMLIKCVLFNMTYKNKMNKIYDICYIHI